MLSANNIKLSFGSKLIFDQVSFSLLPGERVALVGQNGAGKSTFFKLLAGQLEPDAGSVDLAKAKKIGFLTQTLGLDLEHSVEEALKHGFQGEDYRIEEVLSRLHIKARSEKIKNLSGGERRRVDLARVLLEEPDIFLLDEPTNHLDLGAIKFLVDTFRATNKPLLFISHDSAFIDEVATRIVELDSGKFFAHEASYAQFIENKLIRSDIDQKTLHRKDRLMARELAWLRAGTPARTTKQQARISRAQDLIQEVADEFERTRPKQVEIEETKNKRLAKTILELKDLSFEPLFKNLNLIVTAGQRYGILGPNGSGKTTLLSLISGSRQATSGEIIRGPHTEIIQFDQNRAQLDPEKSLKETLADQGDMVFVEEKPIHIAGYLDRYLFSSADQNRKVSTLSGGEQNRLLLAKLLKHGANCLLLDEPTNDLDSTSLAVLEERLNSHKGVAFIVSHDRRFLDRVCNQMLVFEDRKITNYPGNYTSYERLRPSPDFEKSKSPSPTRRGERTKVKRSFNEEREYAGIEKQVLEAEAKKEELEAILSDPARYQEHTKHAANLREIESKIEHLYERWQYLESLS
ncbi:MAG: ABC-F family ATP-binding cassette domain-containing protein [Deltaproteobacteria bacterium]|nr:ABC-F family ATP-binding cassette domain-containing protein [Deltaproteobacteria bacterium]